MAVLHVIGLGPGDASLLTREGEALMRSGRPLYLRTAVHPTVAWMEKEKIPFTALDHFYEDDADFASVYSDMVAFLLKKAKEEGDIVYAVPGSPLVAERTVVLLREKADSAGVTLHITTGMSFLEVLYCRLGLDPVEGLTIADGESLEDIPATILHPLVITQIYSRAVASDVKLTLMDRYSDESPITLVRHLSLPDETVETMPLYELDRHDADHLTLALFDPRKALEREGETFSLKRITEVMKALREPGGCPWDRMQTHETLRTYLLQEVAEVLDAIDNKDEENLKEELGDVLLQVVFHARLAEEAGLFTMQDVIDGIADKMIRRHPFVFGRVQKSEAAEAIGSWEMEKMKEKGRSHLLSGLSESLPSLLFACIMQKKVSSAGLETADTEEILTRFESSWKEAIRQVKHGGEHSEESCGRALFEAVALLRHLHVDPEMALRHFNSNYARAFTAWENELLQKGTDLRTLPPAEARRLWLLRTGK